jgi:predicted PurR-regulated permease PerM
VVPSLILQLQALILNLPGAVTQIEQILSAFYSPTQLGSSQQLQNLVSQLATNLAGSLPALILFPLQVGTIVFYGLITVVISFYWLLASKRVNALAVLAAPPAMRDETAEIIDGMGARVGGWVRAQLFLSVSIGVLTFIGLALLGVPFALVLAVWAAFTELIPIVGPILGAIPALIIAFFNSPLQAIFVLILYLVIQQIENHILVPNVMSHEIGLHPVLVIVALLMGAEYLGLIGALLAVPLASALEVLVVHLARHYAARNSKTT